MRVSSKLGLGSLQMKIIALIGLAPLVENIRSFSCTTQIKVKVLPQGATVTYRVGLGLHSNTGEGNILMRIVCLHPSIGCPDKL